MEALKEHPAVDGSAKSRLFSGATVLCDGAMGTMLYSCGVFINRCYDELNLSQPDTVRAVHVEYLQAGAEVVETNTFGGNFFRLDRYGLAGKLREINHAGVRIARECVEAIRDKQASDAFVAGAVGPLGVRIEPWGTVTLDQAREAFAEQIRALAEGGPGVGADLLIIETMTSLAEAEQAVLAARAEAPDLPLIVMVTVDEEANGLDGTPPEEIARRLTELGADAVGCNCSAGPAIVLSAIERMRSATLLPLAAMPNAGIPKAVDGRTIYMSSPGVHGELRSQVRQGWRQSGRRLLRNHAQPHSCHARRSARYARAAGECRGDGEVRVRQPDRAEG